MFVIFQEFILYMVGINREGLNLYPYTRYVPRWEDCSYFIVAFGFLLHDFTTLSLICRHQNRRSFLEDVHALLLQFQSALKQMLNDVTDIA